MKVSSWELHTAVGEGSGGGSFPEPSHGKEGVSNPDHKGKVAKGDGAVGSAFRARGVQLAGISSIGGGSSEPKDDPQKAEDELNHGELEGSKRG